LRATGITVGPIRELFANYSIINSPIINVPAPFTDGPPLLAGRAGIGPGRLRILLTERRTAMVGMKIWFVGVAFVGMAAGAAAAGLLWMVLTQPVALAQFLSASL
jgi:hypothetical protein